MGIDPAQRVFMRASAVLQGRLLTLGPAECFVTGNRQLVDGLSS
jgi:hypothetical protein